MIIYFKVEPKFYAAIKKRWPVDCLYPGARGVLEYVGIRVVLITSTFTYLVPINNKKKNDLYKILAQSDKCEPTLNGHKVLKFSPGK